LLMFCLDDLSIADRGLVKSPTTTVLQSICAFKSFSVCLMKLGTLMLDAYRLIIVISFWCIAFYLYEVSFFISFDKWKFEVYFVWYKHCYSCLFWGAIDLVNLLSAFHPKPVFISVNKVGLL
jgi:hypothetical protein